jgi:hypothetical protein
MASPIRLVALASALLAALPAGAEVYRWTDAQGEVHYSSDLNDVPVAQREAAKAGAGATGRGAVMRIEAKPRPQPAAAPTAPPAAAPVPQRPAEETYGGRNESSWRAEAAQYRKAIEQLEQQAAACTAGEFPWSAGARGRTAADESADDACGRIQNELEMNRRWQERFEETAHGAGVPPGWLRD